MRIREATPDDIEAITEVISSAFGEAQSSHDGEVIEALLVKELLEDRHDLVNLVAEDTDILGHVFVSPVSLEPDRGLLCGQVAPLSVLPKYQSIGLGRALMHAVIEKSKVTGLDALFLLGDPDYYQAFGFFPSKLRSAYGPSDFFQQLNLSNETIEPKDAYVRLAPAFVRLDL